jgi:arginyl-tRNA synthetase
VYRREQKKLQERLSSILHDKFGIDSPTLAIEQPPEIRFGEYALPLAFELARKLKRAPRKIAEEIITELGPLEGFAAFEVAGAGYINARLDRSAAMQALAADRATHLAETETQTHALVEHTSINPNKAAHVGHLRNAILGDTFVRLLRATGAKVAVQNYIDNTGVQVADIVVGLMHLEGLDRAGVAAWMAALAADGTRIDYACWDLYARTSQWYTSGTPEENAARKQLRLDTLHAIEAGANDTAAIGDAVATAVLRRHLETMLRLGIEYDLLPRESEILHLHFWDVAFEQLKSSGVLYLETAGKNKGCWVMQRVGAPPVCKICPNQPPDEDAKVIVRSNGTVTYVGKDIAYHLWKFGLLGGAGGHSPVGAGGEVLVKDFGYLPFFEYADRHAWITTAGPGVSEHPHFGGATAIYNVIDTRQSDPQANVIEALRGMGYLDAALHYTHFSYEMVALTPRCALELGYPISEEDQARPYIEVSGRKGFGVKADDLIDRLIEATTAEVASRNPDLSEAQRTQTAKQIAVGALRYFMLKFTRNTVIAFDFKDALSFEGETGPYLQYAVVRTASIFRKAGVDPTDALHKAATLDAAQHLDGEQGDSIWQVWLRAAKTSLVLEQSIQTAEPAHLARHAFLLAQEFSNFYRKHHILTETDETRKTLLLATVAVAQRELTRSLAILGITAPEVM